MKIAVSELRPNPFRNLDHYPINQEKVDALVRSIKDTDFWDNLLCRKAPDGNGYELAYGVHRLTACRKIGLKEVDIPVRDLDDTTMAKIMANENMEEWGSNAAIEQETVRAIVQGYADGRIKIARPPKNSTTADMRYAPNFQPGVYPPSPGGKDHPYTVGTLTQFLGWKEYKIDAALKGLALIDAGVATPDQFRGLASTQAREVGRQGERILRETKDPTQAKRDAKKVVSHLSKGMAATTKDQETVDASGRKRKVKGITRDAARRIADEVLGRNIKADPGKKERKVPEINRFAAGLCRSMADFFDNRQEHWKAVISYQDALHPGSKRDLISSLKRVIKIAQGYLDKLEAQSDSGAARASKPRQIEHRR